MTDPQRPPGRPVIGNQVKVALGGLLPEVEAWAASHGLNRAETIRILLRRGLDVPGPAGKTPPANNPEGEPCP